MKKRDVLQLALQCNFLATSDTYNSPYLYIVNVTNKLQELQKLQLTVYKMQLITTQSQQVFFNYYATPL